MIEHDIEIEHGTVGQLPSIVLRDRLLRTILLTTNLVSFCLARDVRLPGTSGLELKKR